MRTTIRRTGWRVAWLALACAVLPASVPAVAPAPVAPWLADYSAEVKAAVNAVSETKLRDHAMLLAGPSYEGREAGSPAGERAAEYLVAHHKQIGMADAVGNGTYLQPFALGSGGGKRGPLTEVNGCVIAKKRGDAQYVQCTLGVELLPFAWSADGDVQGEPVFAGYGISAPDHGYDDYTELDVKGRIVLVLPGGPKGVQGPFATGDAAVHATLKRKAETALAKGAAALLVAGDSQLDPAKPLAEGDAAWPPPAGTGRLALPAALLSEGRAEAVLRLGKKKRVTLVAAIEKALSPASCALPGCFLDLSIHSEGRVSGMGANVCSLWKATAPDAVDEYVVIGAHRDHVGYGKFGSKGKPGQLHPGADDNASGTCGLLELARVVAEKKLMLKRHLLLLHFDGEEKGLLGSVHYCDAPLVPIEKTVAMLNMDMIGRNGVAEMMCGPEEADRNPALQTILLKISARFGVSLPGKGMGQYMNRSDQAPFLRKGIPAIFLFGGDHADYHTQNDTPEKLNYRKMANITKLILLFGVEVAALDQRP